MTWPIVKEGSMRLWVPVGAVEDDVNYAPGAVVDDDGSRSLVTAEGLASALTVIGGEAGGQVIVLPRVAEWSYFDAYPGPDDPDGSVIVSEGGHFYAPLKPIPMYSNQPSQSPQDWRLLLAPTGSRGLQGPLSEFAQFRGEYKYADTYTKGDIVTWKGSVWEYDGTYQVSPPSVPVDSPYDVWRLVFPGGPFTGGEPGTGTWRTDSYNAQPGDFAAQNWTPGGTFAVVKTAVDGQLTFESIDAVGWRVKKGATSHWARNVYFKGFQYLYDVYAEGGDRLTISTPPPSAHTVITQVAQGIPFIKPQIDNDFKVAESDWNVALGLTGVVASTGKVIGRLSDPDLETMAVANEDYAPEREAAFPVAIDNDDEFTVVTVKAVKDENPASEAIQAVYSAHPYEDRVYWMDNVMYLWGLDTTEDETPADADFSSYIKVGQHSYGSNIIPPQCNFFAGYYELWAGVIRHKGPRFTPAGLQLNEGGEQSQHIQGMAKQSVNCFLVKSSFVYVHHTNNGTPKGKDEYRIDPKAELGKDYAEVSINSTLFIKALSNIPQAIGSRYKTNYLSIIIGVPVRTPDGVLHSQSPVSIGSGSCGLSS